jgi:hypothetical protein
MKTQENKTQFAVDTSNRSMKDWIKALCILAVGCTLAYLGVAMFILTNLGVDPFTVVIQGISVCLGVSVGTVQTVVMINLLIIMFLFTKDYVKPGSVVSTLFGGALIDGYSYLIGPFIHQGLSIPVRFLWMMMGCVILALGISIVVNSNAGTGPNDLISLILTDKFHRFSYRSVRIACDLTLVVVGFCLGGTVGVGTIVAVLLTGPVVQFFLPKTKRIIDKIQKEDVSHLQQS